MEGTVMAMADHYSGTSFQIPDKNVLLCCPPHHGQVFRSGRKCIEATKVPQIILGFENRAIFRNGSSSTYKNREPGFLRNHATS